MYGPFRKSDLVKPKEIALKAGILTSKIAFYTSIGLITPRDYSEGGQKLYNEQETLLQLQRISKLIEKGFSLEQIGQRIACVRNLRRILVIDDEQEVVDLIMDTLKDQFNFDISIAMDGFDAGKMLNVHFPDLVILDLHLPGINGFDLCKYIRTDPLHKGVKILAVTGYSSEANVKRILESGADACLAKPFHIDEFKTSVFRLLKIKKSGKHSFLAREDV